MVINTAYFGEIKITEGEIIHFPIGLPGFPDAKRFVLLGRPEEGDIFQYLQDVDEEDNVFVVIDPHYIIPDYTAEIPDEEVEGLFINDVMKTLLLCIVLVPQKMEDMTANLMAPIIINLEAHLGKQVLITEHPVYHVRYPIYKALTGGGDK